MSSKYTALMVLSFAYGGFCLISYLFMVYSIIWMGEPVEMMEFPSNRPRAVFSANNTDSFYTNATTSTMINNSLQQRRLLSRRPDPLVVVTSPSMLILLISGLVSIVNGTALRRLTREKEKKQITAELTSHMLGDEEKEILSNLEKAGGILTQKNLSEITGYSRVKIHRIVQKLESKKMIKKIPNGQTNKIILNTEVGDKQEKG